MKCGLPDIELCSPTVLLNGKVAARVPRKMICPQHVNSSAQGSDGNTNPCAHIAAMMQQNPDCECNCKVIPGHSDEAGHEHLCRSEGEVLVQVAEDEQERAEREECLRVRHHVRH